MRWIRCTLVVLGVVGGLVAPGARGDEPIAVPSVTRIDYMQPDAALLISPAFGDVAQIRAIAAPLRGDTPEQTIAAIGRWIDKNLQYDARAAYEFRTVDAAVRGKVYGGCADHAVVFTALARAAGIPTVFVKTMDIDWIREFRATGTCQVWSGHVFLEVFIGGKWRLLNATELQLHDDYSPAMRILPGSRYAYDKGIDPRAIILSPDWDRWKQQTAAYFSTFDMSQLPVGMGRDVGSADDIYIAANSPIWQALTRRAQAMGQRVAYSFNDKFATSLARARGHRLLIACVGSQVVLPSEYQAHYLPITTAEIRARVERDGAGVARKRLDDGTRVVLLYARDVATLLNLVESFDLTPAD